MSRAGARVEAPESGVLDEDPEVAFAFSGRREGNVSYTVGPGTVGPGTVGPADVRSARRRVAALVGAEPGDSVFMEQVHGARAAVVGAADRGRGLGGREDAIPGVDALVTFDSGVALHVLVADCVPVLLAEPGGAVAAVHAGRAGVEQGVVESALLDMRVRDPGEVVALVGPAIGVCCYEVPAAMRDAVARQVPQAWGETQAGTPALDLPAAVLAQLGALGVERVRRVGGCTRCHDGTWFSHRGDPDGPGSGRQAAVVHRRPAARHLRGAGRLRT